MLALPFKFRLAERQADELRRLDEAWARFLHRDAEAGVFDRRRATAEAEQAAPAAQNVQQRDLFGDADRVVPWQHDDGGTKCDALGAAGEIAQQLRRRRRHRIAGEVVLQRENGVEAERLGKIAEFQMVPIDGNVRPSRLGQDAERYTDLHGRRLLCNRAECVRMAQQGEGSGS